MPSLLTQATSTLPQAVADRACPETGRDPVIHRAAFLAAEFEWLEAMDRLVAEAKARARE